MLPPTVGEEIVAAEPTGTLHHVLAAHREERIDLVVLDLMMPRLSGLDVLDRIRGNDKWKDMPCIILTAAGHEQHERDARDGGATDFLTKPFSPKKLYSRIAELTGVSTDESNTDAAVGAP